MAIGTRDVVEEEKDGVRKSQGSSPEVQSSSGSLETEEEEWKDACTTDLETESIRESFEARTAP